MSYVDNKAAKKKSHGEILSEIAAELHKYLKDYPEAVLVREKALSVVGPTSGVNVIQVLHKVVGVTDLYGWACGRREWEELAPSTIKSIVGGNRKADKDAVAAGLEKYVGRLEYDVDDESDAVAVGIAWLIQKNFLEKVEGG